MLKPSPLAFAIIVCRARRPFTIESVLENSGHLVLVVSSGWAQQRPSLVAQLVKNPPANVGDARDSSLIPESERSPGEGHDHQLQCSCLGNPIDRGAWRATAHGVTESKVTECACVHRLNRRDRGSCVNVSQGQSGDEEESHWTHTSVMKSSHLALIHPPATTSLPHTHSPGTHLSSLRMLLLFHPTGLLSNVPTSLA